MLINEVVDAKAIALSATENASNQIPYLGLNWFPTKTKEGLDLKWIKTSKGLPVTLAPSNFDAIPVVRARKGLATEKTQMAFFREQMMISEADEQEIARIKEANDPYLESALRSIYDDANTLVAGADVVPEIMRMQLLATTNGRPVITLSSDGVNYTYDYDPDGAYAASHYAKITTANLKWNVPATAKPLTDLVNAKKAQAKIGKVMKYALMNSVTFGYLVASDQVKSAILAQNATANIFMSDAIVVSAVKAITGLDIIIYDKMYTDYSGTDQKFYPDNKVTLLPEGNLGGTWYGTTPEMRTARQVADVDVAIYGAGVSIATKTVYGPPAETTITASEIVLPSYEGMESTFVIEVA